MVPERLWAPLLVTVTVVWAINFLAGLIPPLEYDPAESINGIFTVIVGGAIALGKSRSKGGDGDA